ncbi:hypothetical protein L7F22_069023 [Adiantum nelumboides]|nr:hypothetical protein [Adiantum nelumboides]
MSLQGILTTLSQTDGKYLYDYGTVPLLAELLKLTISIFMLWKEETATGIRSSLDWRTARLYPIPSLIYLIHNNVQFATLTYVDTSTYQILGNLKIVTTGILFRVFLRRKLSNLQWMAIALLTVGTTTSQIKGCGEGHCGSLFSSPYEGYVLGIVSAFLSASAGVYTEFLMKKTNDSLYWQNAQLYVFGVLFNFLRLVLEGGWQKVWGLLNGYGYLTWLVVLNLGCTGLLVSWIMKYADNIVKVYATSLAMLLTMIFSIFLFNFKPSLQLFMGIIICTMSLQMYFTPPHLLLDLPSPQKDTNTSLTGINIDKSSGNT